MTSWILIVIWAAASSQEPRNDRYNTDTAVAMQEFNTQASCEAAKFFLTQHGVAGGSATCVKK